MSKPRDLSWIRDEYTVYFASPRWSLNGVNMFSKRLAEGLLAKSWNTKILLTEKNADDEKPLDTPKKLDIETFPNREHHGWKKRYYRFRDFLEARTPCIYFPNHDFKLSGVSPSLSDEVIIIGSLRSNDVRHFNHLNRLGQYWNKITCVSQALLSMAKERFPELSARLSYIANGVPTPDEPPVIPLNPNSPIQIVYSGRVQQKQKRIFDFIPMVKQLKSCDHNFTLHVAGDGRDRKSFEHKTQPFIKEDSIRMHGTLSNDDLLELLEKSHFFVLPSEYEGMSNSLLEAMSRGCVPIATNIESGTSELINHEQNGILAPIGSPQRLAEWIEHFIRNPKEYEKYANRAWKTIKDNFDRDGMVSSYEKLFTEAIHEVQQNKFSRPRESFKPPPELWKNKLPDAVVEFAKSLKDVWRRYAQPWLRRLTL